MKIIFSPDENALRLDNSSLYVLPVVSQIGVQQVKNSLSREAGVASRREAEKCGNLTQS